MANRINLARIQPPASGGDVMRDIRDARSARFDLAKMERDEALAQKAREKAEQVAARMGKYIVERENQGHPVDTGVDLGQFAPAPLGYNRSLEIPKAPRPIDYSDIEKRARLDLAAIDPTASEAFRTGRIAEEQGMEDRTRKQAAEAAEAARKERELESLDTYRKGMVENQRLLAMLRAKGAAGRPIPASAMTKIVENIQNARRAQEAVKLLGGQDVGTMKGDKKALGWMKGVLGGMGDWGSVALNNLDPKGVDTRAAVADLGSMIIHDRSGAAVTAAEYPRLRPFIPKITDSPADAKRKLERFVQVYNTIIEDMADAFGPEAGYAANPMIQQYLAAQASPELLRNPNAGVPGAQPQPPAGDPVSDEDAALQWAMENPDDPYAQQILDALGR